MFFTSSWCPAERGAARFTRLDAMSDEETKTRIANLDQRIKDWEENQRWQLNQLRGQLKHIGYMADWCAACLLVIAVVLVKETYFK